MMKKRVAVIGAGLAGLTAAYNLEQEGVDVVVFEAGDRVGGRVFTHTYADGSYAELGALSISGAEDAIKAMAAKFELPIVARHDRMTGKRYHAGGEFVANAGPATRFLFATASKLEFGECFDDLPEDLKALDMITMAEFIEMHLTEIKDADDQPLSLEQAIQDMQSSLLGLYVDDLSKVSALDALRYINQYTKGGGTHSIKGGNQRLPEAMAASLKDMRLNSVVMRIEHAAMGVAVHLADSSELFDAVVVAVPLPALQQIHFTPALKQADLLSQTPYNTSVSRVYFQAKENFWGEDQSTAMALTDQPTFWVEHHTAHVPDMTPVIEAHGSGPVGIEMREATEPAQYALHCLEAVYPDIQQSLDQVHDVVTKFWHADTPLFGGAYPYFAPGQLSRHAELSIPQGAIVFAGEYTGWKHPASMNGAVVSGHRATQQVKKILNAGVMSALKKQGLCGEVMAAGKVIGMNLDAASVEATIAFVSK